MKRRKACEGLSQQRRLAFRQGSKHRLLNLIDGHEIAYLKLPPSGAKAPLKSDSSEKKGLRAQNFFVGARGSHPRQLRYPCHQDLSLSWQVLQVLGYY